jgi:predicted phosphoadenosine phosphosulfate sulfurtransferase
MRAKILNYISTWEKRGYPDGIPDETDSNLELMNKVPSYRAICKAILKNDIALTSLGFSRSKSEVYSAFKKVEIENRGRLSSSAKKDEICI